MKNKVILAVALTAAAVIFAGCKKGGVPENEQSNIEKMAAEAMQKEAGTMLFDYFYKVVGTPNETGHSEICIFSLSETEVEVKTYEKSDGESDEIVKTYHAPASLVQEALTHIGQNKMYEWNTLKNPVPIDGASYVAKFYWNGELVRVSGESMPEEGPRIFGELRTILYRYVTEDRFVE